MGKIVPFVGMVVAVLTQSGSQVVSKIAMNGGINKYVLIFYTNALSSFLLLPSFIFLLLRPHPPPLNFSFISRFFLLALFGCSANVLGYVGIDLSSPTLATAMINLVPAFTFGLALIFRMEVVHFRQHSSQAKVFGTIISIGGAFVVIFYKGTPLLKTYSSSSVSSDKFLFSAKSNWILGGFYCAADSLLTSLWYIYQASVMKNYPSVTVVAFFQIFFSTVLSAIFALIAVRDVSVWVLRLDMGLFSVFYQAVVATVIRLIVTTWCVQKAGPLFCTMFKPVGIIFTVTMGALFVGDAFHLGSLVGAVIIVVGFYTVMWGKAREEETKLEGEFENLESSSHNAPLLQNKI